VSGWLGLTATDWAPRLVGAGVEPGVAARLGGFLELLGRWQRVTNLIGNVDAERLVGQHVGESLAALPLLPSAGALLDVGSGNGFPAVPLLLARPGQRGILLEPRERRWAFLKEAVRQLGLAAEVRRERIAAHRGGPYDAITVRALATGAWAAPALGLLAGDGVLVSWSGETRPPGAAGWRAVLTSAVPAPGRGAVVAWRRCFT
jgi:16S rRNA (guanine527-N7)-methyltransferase